MAIKLTPTLDLNLYPHGQLAERCGLLIRQMTDWENSQGARKRTLKPQDRLARDTTGKVLLANLYQAWKGDPLATLGVILKKNFYSTQRGKIGPLISYTAMKTLLTFLSDRNLIEIASKGKKHPDAKTGIPTQIRAQQGLFEYLNQDAGEYDLRAVHPPVILKATKEEGKKTIIYETDHHIEEIEQGVDLINQKLLESWPDIQLSDQDMARFKDEGIDLCPKIYTHRTVYRVFNNGTFDEGGRLYGGWWQQVPSRLRQHITIDGMPTVEMDYSALHPRLIYAEKGLEFNGDPYDVGLDDKFRPLVKVTFQKLINGRGEARQPRPGSNEPTFDPSHVGLSWNQFVDQIKDAHSQISDLFGTGIGLRLQRRDSDIAQAVMLEFNQWGIPMLPIHDSFLVSLRYEGDLLLAMRQAMKKHSGIDVPIKNANRSISNLTAQLSKHWEQYYQYDPSQDHNQEP